MPKSKKIEEYNTLLEYLIENPTKSITQIAKDLHSYRQRIWRIKKDLENKNIIWGYTTVVDESKQNYVLYVALLKLKPPTKELADTILKRLKGRAQIKEGVRLINVLYVNGEYDCIMMFSAPDHRIARRYYDYVRTIYKDHLVEKPMLVDVNFPLIREGKMNPELEKLYDFVPIQS